MNKVILAGRLTADPQLKFSAGKGTAITNFSLAVDNPFKKGQANFINCVIFNKGAETIAQYVTKGQQLLVEGAWRNETYTKDGITRTVSKCYVEKFEFIGNKQSDKSDNSKSNDDQYFYEAEEIEPIFGEGTPF